MAYTFGYGKQKTQPQDIRNIQGTLQRGFTQESPRLLTKPIQDKTTTEKITGIIPKPILKQLNSDSLLFTSPFTIVNKIFPSKFGKETDRLRKRFLDSATFGITGEADKALGKDINYREGRSFKNNKLGAALDFASTTAGYLIPGLGTVKGLKLIGMSAKSIPKLAKGASKIEKFKRTTKVLGQQAKEGAITGAVIGGAEIGVREAINPDDYSAKQNFQKIGQDILLGTILDPIAYGGIKGISKLISKARKTPEVDNVLNDINTVKNLEEVKNTINDVETGKQNVQDVILKTNPKIQLPKVAKQQISGIRFGTKDLDNKLKLEQDEFKKNFLSDEKIQKIKEIKDKYNNLRKTYEDNPYFSNEQKEKYLKDVVIKESADIRKEIQGDYLIKVPGGLSDKELSSKVNSFLAIKPGNEVVFERKSATVKSVDKGLINLEFKDGTKKTVLFSQVNKKNELKKIVNKQTEQLKKILKKSDSTENLGFRSGTFNESEVSETLSQQSGSRGTGHFGTGHYFFGSEQLAKKFRPDSKRPVSKINLSNLNLFRPKNEDIGLKLHETLKKANNEFFTDVNPIKFSEIIKKNSIKDLKKIFDSFEFKNKNIINSDIEKTINDFVDEVVIDFKKNENFSIDDIRKIKNNFVNELFSKLRNNFVEQGNIKIPENKYESEMRTELNKIFDKKSVDDLLDDFYIEDVKVNPKLQKLYDKEQERIFALTQKMIPSKEIENISNEYFDDKILGLINSQNSIFNTNNLIIDIKEVFKMNGRNLTVEELNSIKKILQTKPKKVNGVISEKEESYSTKIMKMLGYDGVDVRGIKFLDNEKYGSVIYQDGLNKINKITPSKKLTISKTTFEKLGIKGLNQVEVIKSKPTTEREKNKQFFDEVDKNVETPSAEELAKKPIRGQSVTVKSNLSDIAEDSARKFQSNFVDELDPINKLDKDIHLLKSDTSRANNLTNESVEGRNQLDLNGNVVGNGLNKIIESSGNPIEFEKYLFYRQAISRGELGDLVLSKEKILQDGLTPKKMAEIVKELELKNPKFIQAGKDWNSYHANIRKMMLDEGNWTPEYVAKLEELYPNYAAFFRNMDGKSKIRIGKGVKKGGSEREVMDLFASSAELTRLYYNFMLHNRANRELLKKIKENPEFYKEQGISIVDSKKIKEKDASSEFIEDLVNFENSLQTKSLEKGTQTAQPNEITAFENGEKITIKIEDPEIYQAFASMPEQTRGMLLKTFENLTKATKQAATGVLAPIWSTKGLAMDITRALLNAENPIAHLGLLVKATMDSFTRSGKNLKNLADNYYNAGGGFSGALRTSPEARYSTSNLKGTGLKSAGYRAWRVINPFDRKSFLAQTQDFFENLNRIAAYDYKINKLTGGKRKPTPKEIAIALKYAREITTDYTVKGRLTKKAEKFSPYTTASIAGTTQLLKSIQKNKMKSAALIGIGIILPKLQEYAQFKDDKDYKALPNREKYRNIIYGKTEDGKFLKIPVDPGLLVIGEMFSRSLQAYEQKDKSAFNGAMEEVLNSYAPPPVSGILKSFTTSDGIAGGVRGLGMASSLSPFVAVATNKTFTNAPIESLEYQLSPLRPGLRYNEKTSNVSKWLGKNTNFSPLKIDYIIKNYGGDLARFILPLNSDAGSIKTEDFLKNFMTDPTFTNNLSIQFYKGRDKLKSARAEKLDLGKELPKWYNEKLYQAITSQANNSVNKKLSYYNQLKRSTSIDKNLTATQRREKIRKIQKVINETYLDWNTLMKKYGVPLE